MKKGGYYLFSLLSTLLSSLYSIDDGERRNQSGDEKVGRWSKGENEKRKDERFFLSSPPYTRAHARKRKKRRCAHDRNHFHHGSEE